MVQTFVGIVKKENYNSARTFQHETLLLFITLARKLPCASHSLHYTKEAVITQKDFVLPISKGRSNLTLSFDYFVDGPKVIASDDVSPNNRKRALSRHLLGSSYLEYEGQQDRCVSSAIS